MNVARIYECRETRSRMSRDCRTNENETKATFMGDSQDKLTNVSRLLYNSRAIIVRLSRDIKLDRNSRIGHINAHSMRLQRGSCIYIVNLCREIVPK